MYSFKNKFLVGILELLLLFIVLFICLRNVSKQAKEATLPQQVRLGSVAESPKIQTVRNKIEPVPVPGKEALASDYRQTRNLRAFIETAKTQAQYGGIYYAIRAMQECQTPRQIGFLKKTDIRSQVDNPLNENHQLAVARENALNFLRERCAGLEGEDLVAEMSKLADSELVKQDPILDLNKKRGMIYQNNPSVEQQKNLVSEILAMHDPEVLEHWGGGRYEMPVAFSKTGTVTEKEQSAYISAWRIVGCDFGDACDSQDLQVIEACYHGSICENSRLAILRKSIESDKDSGVQFDDVIALKDKIVQAIRNKNVDVFIQARK